MYQRTHLGVIPFLGLVAVVLLPAKASAQTVKQVGRVPPARLAQLAQPSPETTIGRSLTTAVQLGVLRIGARQKAIRYQAYDRRFALIEGDILVPLDRIRTIPGVEAAGSPTGPDVYGRWPGGIVYYTIAKGLPNQQRVNDAIKHWEDNTAIRFLEAHPANRDFVTFVPVNDGCAASIGMVGGEQFVRLSGDCSTGNTIHEIGHTVGLWHEHTRNDRDSFIDVFLENVEDGKAHNFEMKSERGFTGQDFGSYDFSSIMHYGSYFFTKNNKATLLRDNGDEIVAQRDALNRGDLDDVRALYDGYIHGDCLSFSPDRVEVKKVDGSWRLVDDTHSLFGFGEEEGEARQALEIIRAYRLAQSCFVGRPHASMKYLLTADGQAPGGRAVAGEDCVGLDNSKIVIEASDAGSRYRILHGKSVLLDFGDKRDEAYRSYRVIKDYGISAECFVGRPHASFTYWKR